MSSFGGGVSALMMREFVTTRRWISEADFIDGLAISQALPGVNVVNISIWMGYKLRYGIGAAVACLGVILPGAIIIVLASEVLHSATEWPLVGLALSGLSAAALGVSFNLSFRTIRRAVSKSLLPLTVFVATLAAAYLNVPTIVTVAVLAPISIALCYWSASRGQ
ncbi:MAG: chromate transporter [Rhizobiaceae bacterium]|nr:chromate transporter [Rhizobiaceae bacterium]